MCVCVWYSHLCVVGTSCLSHTDKIHFSDTKLRFSTALTVTMVTRLLTGYYTGVNHTGLLGGCVCVCVWSLNDSKASLVPVAFCLL